MFLLPSWGGTRDKPKNVCVGGLLGPKGTQQKHSPKFAPTDYASLLHKTINKFSNCSHVIGHVNFFNWKIFPPSSSLFHQNWSVLKACKNSFVYLWEQTPNKCGFQRCRMPSRDNHELALWSLQNIKETAGHITWKVGFVWPFYKPFSDFLNQNGGFFQNHWTQPTKH